MKGSGAHLLKTGSKRRRKQVNMVGQNEPEELSAMEDMEQASRIEELE